MNKEAQQRAITEACGSQSYTPLPDYLNDLNAMHEAENTLRPSGVPAYSQEILKITGATGEGWINVWAVYHATAEQRAEAFLKSTGRWKYE